MPPRSILLPYEVEPESPVGGKARALAVLSQAGLPVPEWFVVPPEAFFASVPDDVAAEFRQAPSAEAVQALLRRVVIAGDAVEHLTAAVERICPDGEACAVRSSAIEEDSARFSFAGQLDSFLFVPAGEVPARVVDVWRSGFSQRLLRYRREAGMDVMSGVPAVIVQRMIGGKVSGVAFSADPVSGRRGIAVVAAVPGLGSALVSGEAAADTWRVDRQHRIVEARIETKRVMHRADPTRPEGVAPAAVPPQLSSVPALLDAQVEAVASLARSAEAYFGRPQDIEWTIGDGRLFLLQSRPITTLADKPDPDGSRMLWDNSNIIESYSGITTPLTFSFARRAYEHVYREFCRLAGVPEPTIDANADMFSCMIGLVRGRVYYNLLNWYRLMALLPGYATNHKFLEQMLGVRQGLPEGLVAVPFRTRARERLRDRTRLARTFVALAVDILTLPWRMDRFYQRLSLALGSGAAQLPGLRPDELVAYYRELERQLLTHWDAPVVNDFGTMIFHGLLRKLSTAWIGDAAGTLSNDLLCADRGMISEEPARRVRALAQLAAADGEFVRLLCAGTLPAIRDELRRHCEFDRALGDYLDKFGDRCMEELKLESLTLHDDPLPLLRAVGQYARNLGLGTSPVATPAELQTRKTAEARVEQALARYPLRRLTFGWVLRNARARVRARENLRFERTRVFGRARQIFVELGRRFAAIDGLEHPRDIFYLELDEVLGYVEGWATTANLKALAVLRKAEFEAYRSLPAPADRFETRGLIHKGHTFGAEQTGESITGETLQGLGCCPGIVRGPVRLVHDPSSAAVQPGEIIVAERTDPGWVMIFPAASGLLVERGSLLSHSAIVARELGLPAIVSLAGVTRWLTDGDWVRMDGSTGVVAKLTRSEERMRDGAA